MRTAGCTVEIGLPLVNRYPYSHARTGLLKVLVDAEKQTGSFKLQPADIEGMSESWLSGFSHDIHIPTTKCFIAQPVSFLLLLGSHLITVSLYAVPVQIIDRGRKLPKAFLDLAHHASGTLLSRFGHVFGFIEDITIRWHKHAELDKLWAGHARRGIADSGISSSRPGPGRSHCLIGRLLPASMSALQGTCRSMKVLTHRELASGELTVRIVATEPPIHWAEREP